MADTMRGRWDVWSVHPLCRSGHHEMCKQYEDWNWRAMHICGCEECDHPKPTREELNEHELKVYGRVLHQEKAPDELDASSSADVASWFVGDDDPEPNGHDEAHEPETTMSTTEAVPEVTPPTDADGEITYTDPELAEEHPIEGSAEVASVEESAEEAGDAPDGDADDETPTKTRARGELESEVKAITDKFLSGKIKLPEDKVLTPHYIALAIEKAFGYDEPPSTGAVAAVLNRWNQYGYARFGDTPFHFTGLTERGESEGLASLRESFKEARKEERRREREAARAAAAEADDTDTDTDEGGDE